MSVNFAFLDSGTGGLPYLKYLLQKSPEEKCVYVGDTKNFPYGQKSTEEIIQNSAECVKKIIEKFSPKAIIVACNTISVTALESLRKSFPGVSFIGTVPAIKPAAKISKTKKIGLLATNATVNHPYTKKLISDFASDCKIISKGDPELIDFIEHKFFHATEEERILKVQNCVDFFKNQNCDVLVLACTHFLNMVDYFKKAAKNDLQIVDNREGVVNHALEIEKLNLQKNTLYIEESSKLFVTGLTQKNDAEFYETFCAQNNIKFGGILN